MVSQPVRLSYITTAAAPRLERPPEKSYFSCPCDQISNFTPWGFDWASFKCRRQILRRTAVMLAVRKWRADKEVGLDDQASSRAPRLGKRATIVTAVMDLRPQIPPEHFLHPQPGPSVLRQIPWCPFPQKLLLRGYTRNQPSRALHGGPCPLLGSRGGGLCSSGQAVRGCNV